MFQHFCWFSWEVDIDIRDWILLLSLPAAGLLAGFVFERLALKRIRVLAARTEWIWDDILINSFKKLSIPAFVLLGAYAALHFIPIKPALLAWAQKAIYSVWALLATVFLARLIKTLVHRSVTPIGSTIPSVSILSYLVSAVVYAVGLLVIFQSLGISITPLLTTLGVGGIAVALALQETLSNFFSGIHVLVSRQIRPGDFIKLENGPEGTVEDITWRNTTIRTLPNNLVIVPNAKIASSIITNYTLPDPEMAVLVNLGVAYGSDLEKVERVTIETSREAFSVCEGAAPGFDPFIRYHTFGDFAIQFTVILRAKKFVDQYLLKHVFIKRLAERYREAGIEIPFPIRTVHMAPPGSKEASVD